jgi:hypothetical protein
VQIGQKAALGPVVGVGHVVPRHWLLAGYLAYTCHGGTPNSEKGQIIRHYPAEFQAQIHPVAEAQYIQGKPQTPVSEAIHDSGLRLPRRKPIELRLAQGRDLRHRYLVAIAPAQAD